MPINNESRPVLKASDVQRIVTALIPPKWDSGVFSWSLDEIRNARDSQMRGDFFLASKLADAMRTDDALFVAYNNRLAPQRCLGVEINPGVGPRSDKIAIEADTLFGKKGVCVSADTLSDIVGDLANHDLAVGHIIQKPREDGSRIDFYLEHWPLRHVRFDQAKQCLVTRIDGGSEVEIVHGNGEWVVFSKHTTEPWKKDAAVLPGALVWAAHAFAANDWAKGSRSHGNAKVVGEMPEGYAIEDENGLTREAQQFLQLLAALANDDSPSGIKPFGAKVEYLVNSSSAWQVWQSLLENREKAAARIYLGTDGTLGASGGAPGVDITALFGVATTIVQGDLRCIQRALQTGLIDPWCAINFGDSRCAPSREYLIPDQDEEATLEAFATRNEKFFAAIKAAKELGFVVDQLFIDETAEKYKVPAPRLPLGVVESAQADQAATVAATVTEGPNEAQELADAMTAAGIPRCEHGYINRCPKCGIERARGFEMGPDGKPIWKIAWRPITV